MKRIVVFLIMVSSLSAGAQTFEESINKASSLSRTKDYVNAAKAFDAAFNLKEGTDSQYYNAACISALNGNKEKALLYLQKSAEKGWHDLRHVKSDNDLKSLHGEEAWKSVLSKIEFNKKEYEKDFDIPLKEKLDGVFVKDQMLRGLYRSAEEKYGRGSAEIKYFCKLIASEDKANAIEILKIIEERGWVGISLVGEKANNTLWLVVQHAGLDIQKKYLPLLKESVKKGESTGNQLALLEDRILMREGKPQIYGSQITQNMKTGKMEVYKVEEPEYVNKRRKEVGLGPIEDYIGHWGLEWNVEQK